MYSAGIIIFFLAIVDPFLCEEKQEPITDDPILQHFNMDRNTEYWFQDDKFVQQLHKRANRSRREFSIEEFNGRLELFLNPTNDTLFTEFTEVYYSRKNSTKPGGVKFFWVRDAMKHVGKLFEDRKHHASVVINRDNYGRTTVNGVARSKRANANLVIRSVPDDVMEQHLRKRRSTGDFPDEDFSKRPDYVSHVVMRVPLSQAKRQPQEGSRYAPSTSQINVSSEVHSKVKRSQYNDEFIYPRLLIELDSGYFTGRSSRKLTSTLEYLMAFWNAVDMPYRSNTHPNIQLHVAIVIIATTPEATPHLFNSQVRGTMLNGSAVLDKAELHWMKVRKSIPLDQYHFAVTMTKRNIDGAGGISNRGYACEDPYTNNKKEAIALIKDNGAFAGIHFAMHEVGHLMGLVHHDPTDRSICRTDNTNIMTSYMEVSTTSAFFSGCSKNALTALLKIKKFSCMYQKPTALKPGIPRVMPGKLMSLDKQCQAIGYKKACSTVELDRVCVKLKCVKEIEETPNGPEEICTEELNHMPAPGSFCVSDINGRKGFCVDSQCYNFYR